MKKRCSWVSESQLYIEYHDKEWGEPVTDDETLFEFLILETFQAGLSWSTILNKRAQFRIAFDGFDCQKIAKYTTYKFELLMQDTGIVRNKLKIEVPYQMPNVLSRCKKIMDLSLILFGPM